MARFTIYSKDGKTVRHSGKLKYNGTYLKTSYVEFQEIASPEPIEWQVGDYVDYGRTGLRYKLYYIPQPKKQARRNSVEEAFVYENVQFHASTKMLERAIFHDIVKSDNAIHFSTRETLSTYEDVYGIVTRIQECMDELYPGMWTIKVMDGITEESAPELYAQLHEPKEFSISGTCLDALSNIYNTWPTIGWVHTYDAEAGKDVITIGRPNVRADINSTSQFVYGRGNGLTAIKKSYTNSEEIATRLYVYGSDKNLINRYYNNLDIFNAESVDIANLMLPLRIWGKSDNGSGTLKPDARKAYIEKDGPVAEYGLIPKRVYFDGNDNDDVYPSIENFTVGELTAAKKELGDTEYVPSTNIYSDPKERLDELKSAERITDSGVMSSDSGASYTTMLDKTIPAVPEMVIGENEYTVTIADIGLKSMALGGRTSVKTDIMVVLTTVSRLRDPHLRATLLAYQEGVSSPVQQSVDLVYGEDYHIIHSSKDGVERFETEATIPTISANLSGGTFTRIKLTLDVSYEYSSGEPFTGDGYYQKEGNVVVGCKESLASTFKVNIKQIGFDLSKRQATSNGIATLSMKTGMCGGRDFVVTGCRYMKDTDSWELTLKRALDESLNTYFPNKAYQMESGDRFVILDIMMPELYIHVASERLLSLAEELYGQVSRGQSYYEPEVDAKLMAISGQKLQEGMYMCLSDEDIIGVGNEYVLIDTLSIDETDDSIPTYKVTLREKKGVSYKEAVSGAIDSISSKVVLLGGLARQAQTSAYSASEQVQRVDMYAKRNYAQAEETINMLNGAIEGFSEGITPVSVQAMSLLVGSRNLQFVFVKGFNDVSLAAEYPIHFDNDTKILTCDGAFLQHVTLGISDISTATARIATDYYIWKVDGYSSLALDAGYSSKSFYLYVKVKIYDKATAADTDRTGTYILSEKSHSMTEEDGYYYLLVGILSSEVNGGRSFAKLHGYSEVLPGQITTDRIRSTDGGSYIDLQSGDMQLGEKLKYKDGVLTLDFLFSEGANIGGFIFRNNRLESQARDKDDNPMAYLDGVSGEMRLRGTVQLSTAFSGNITDSNIFYLPVLDKNETKSLRMSSTPGDLGKVIKFFNSSPYGGGVYKIGCTSFSIQNGSSAYQIMFDALVGPQEVVELTCFEQTGSTKDNLLGSWEISNRFGFDDLKMSGATGRFPRIVAMGQIVSSGQGVASISGKWFNGTELDRIFGVHNASAGQYAISAKTGYSLPTGYKVFAIGKEAGVTISWQEQNNLMFTMYTTKNGRNGNYSFDFIIFDSNWWYNTK